MTYEAAGGFRLWHMQNTVLPLAKIFLRRKSEIEGSVREREQAMPLCPNMGQRQRAFACGSSRTLLALQSPGRL
jgi:hypothetical protein